MKNELEIISRNTFSDRDVLIIGTPLVSILVVGLVLLHFGII